MTSVNIEHLRIRDTDAQGRLTRAGFMWLEPRPNVTWWLDQAEGLAIACGVAAVILLLFGFWLRASPLALLGLVLAACAGALFGLERHYRRYRDFLCVMAFCDDGAIEVFKRERWATTDVMPPMWVMPVPHTAIASIEVIQAKSESGGHGKVQLYGVWQLAYQLEMVFRDGRNFIFSWNQTDAATMRLVAVQLNIAREEMRKATEMRRLRDAARRRSLERLAQELGLVAQTRG